MTIETGFLSPGFSSIRDNAFFIHLGIAVIIAVFDFIRAVADTDDRRIVLLIFRDREWLLAGKES